MGLDNSFQFCDNPIKEFVNAGFHKYRPHWGWERNLPNASFYYIADGSLKFTLKDKEFFANTNDVVFLKSSDIASISNESDKYSSLYYIAFNYDEEYDLKILRLVKNTSCRKTFKDIVDSNLSKAPYSELKISALLLKLVYTLAVDSLNSNSDYLSTSRIQKAAEYININYYREISVETLCRLTDYSPAHLRRLFVKNLGMSPQNYLLEKRIEMAKEMLLDIPEKTVEEIADLLGICSASYFCKLFKTKTGMSPTEYKLMQSTKKEKENE